MPDRRGPGSVSLPTWNISIAVAKRWPDWWSIERAETAKVVLNARPIFRAARQSAPAVVTRHSDRLPRRSHCIQGRRPSSRRNDVRTSRASGSGVGPRSHPVRLRAECLNAHWFLTLADAAEKLEARRRYHNEERLHGAIGHKVPISLTNHPCQTSPPPAEAALALEIVKGDGRDAAAARLGISLSTARTHLSRIFEKTGAGRQAELVVLLNREGLSVT
jgi:DNA-binding CsgD family transcriptional regulator